MTSLFQNAKMFSSDSECMSHLAQLEARSCLSFEGSTLQQEHDKIWWYIRTSKFFHHCSVTLLKHQVQ